jgi:hypothetical protein
MKYINCTKNGKNHVAMIKVKEWLDENLHPYGETEVKPGYNGHHGVFGAWRYPEDWHGLSKDDTAGLTSEETIERLKHPPDHMYIHINNETALVGNMCVNEKWSIYNYIQTYEHIPRGEPDDNGYYARSTDEEVIKYLDGYLQAIKKNESK